MDYEHWFDVLNRALVRPAPRRMAHGSPRRAILRAAAALAAGLALGGVSTAEAARCGKVVCRIHWPQDTKEGRRNRRSCEATCKRCKRTQTAFCITEGDPNNPAKVADCCEEGEACCGGTECCPAGKCCDDPERGKFCVESSERCCRHAPDGKCSGSAGCCPGIGCVDGIEHNHNHCGSCGNACHPDEYCRDGECLDRCPPGELWCDHSCVDPMRDPNHCGGCGSLNPNGLKCCSGNLCTYINGVCCGGTCYPEGHPPC